MNTPTRLSVFGLTLVAAFATAAGLGRAVGPVGPVAAETEQHTATGEPAGDHGGTAGDESSGQHEADAAPGVTGLSVSERGYRLALDQASLPVGEPGTLSFRVLTSSGEPLTAYTPSHDKDLHLIVVRRDTQHFQHLHPVRDAAGTWTLPVTLPAAGVYKVFVDFAPAGSEDALTLAADVQAGGSYVPEPLPPVAPVTSGGGYAVRIDGDLVAGRPSKVVLSVSRDGRPVTDLQPYLAAYGHLVALRGGDLAYLHTHPQDDAADPSTKPGPGLTFIVDVPTSGTYRLFLDFKHDGRVRTAPFTVAAKGPTSS